jgi:hypothetical protein
MICLYVVERSAAKIALVRRLAALRGNGMLFVWYCCLYLNYIIFILFETNNYLYDYE